MNLCDGQSWISIQNWLGYDRDDSFPFDYKPDGIPFGSKNRKENSHHDHIPINLKGNGNLVLSEQTELPSRAITIIIHTFESGLA